MNINIAFNTIIYIMVFLFPGILFRRSFFSGKFNKHFDSGNNFDRILWSILLSFACLFLYCCFVGMFNAHVKEVFTIDSQEILNSFICIYDNQFPSILDNIESLKNVFYNLSSLYILSGISGFSLNKIILIFGLEKKYSIFRFQNNWDHLTTSNSSNNNNHKLGDIHYTFVDIKTSDDELFTGRLHDISYDKEGKIEAISIAEAYKYYILEKPNDITKIDTIKNSISVFNANLLFYSETNDKFVYKKRIKGNIFTLFNAKISNISITYMKISHFFNELQRMSMYVISIFLLLSFIFFVTYAIWDFHIINFTNQYKRIFFCIISLMMMCFIVILLFDLTSFKLFKSNAKLYTYRVVKSLLLLIYLVFPFLYIFDFINFLGLSIMYILLSPVFNFILKRIEKKFKKNK